MAPVDIGALKQENEEKAHEEFARGPVDPGGSGSSFEEAIRDFHHRDALGFGIPAHRSGTTPVKPSGEALLGTGAYGCDVGMDKGVDDRHQSWRVEKTAMDRFAAACGADETLFSTNGSSENVHVAIQAAVRPGEKIVVARNGHKSTFAGLVQSGARPIYVDPVYDERWQVAHGVDPLHLAAVLDEHPDAKAVMVFSPSYYGVCSDIAAIAELVHARGMALITDDAWGLSFAFCSRLPRSAMHAGWDLGIGSVHKSLSGLQQTSVMSRRGDRIDPERLRLVFELGQSTSASSVLLASIDAARVQFERDGERLLGDSIDLAHRLRGQIRDIDGLELMEVDDIVGGPGAADMNPAHVTFDVTALGMTGYAADDWLREHHQIHVELSDHRRLMVLVSYADTQDRTDRLADALRALAAAPETADRGDIPQFPSYAGLRLEQAMLPRDAFLGATELVPWRQAAGRVSAEMSCPYPPGVPIAAPGERLTDEIVDVLEQVAAAGGMVEGAADPALDQLRVAIE